MKKVAKQVYRRDDRVVIVEPQIFQRVGYAMGYHETHQRLEDTYGRQVIDALASLRHPTAAMQWPGHLVNAWSEMYGEVLHKLTQAELVHHRYGGPERTIHTKLDERFRGKEGWVTGKRCVKTGVRRSGSGPDYWTGETEPPHLTKIKTHVILELAVYLEPRSHDFSCPETIEIEERHVRPNVTQGAGGVSLVHLS